MEAELIRPIIAFSMQQDKMAIKMAIKLRWQ